MAEVCTPHFGEERDNILGGGRGFLSRRNGILRIGWGYMGVLGRGLGHLGEVEGPLGRWGLLWGGVGYS